jgi:DsbC/DsbD-like thiol-disulfide interchange protein
MMKNVPFLKARQLWLAPFLCGGVAIGGSFLTTQAQAQDASPWLKEPHTSARLLAGSRSGTLVLGGIELELDPGWKTYWRNAGDSGVPPRIDFSKSDNVDAVTILWPAPSQFEDGSGGVSFGYKNHVVLPLRIVAKDSDKRREHRRQRADYRARQRAETRHRW